MWCDRTVSQLSSFGAEINMKICIPKHSKQLRKLKIQLLNTLRFTTSKRFHQTHQYRTRNDTYNDSITIALRRAAPVTDDNYASPQG